MADDTTSTLTVKVGADISTFKAKIAEAIADLDALAEKAGSLGIVVEVDDGESDFDTEAAHSAD